MRTPGRRLAAFVAGLSLVALGIGIGGHRADGAVSVEPPVDYGEATSGGGGATASNASGVVVGGAMDNKGSPYRFFPDAPAQQLPQPAGSPGDDGIAMDVNESGTIVGAADNGNAFSASIWVPDEAPAYLPAVADAEVSEASAVNGTGVAVGWAYDDDTSTTSAVRWAPGNPAEVLDPTGQASAVATDVNTAGVVVGHVGGTDQSDAFSAVVWPPGESPVVLPGLGGSQSFATGVNDANEVVGLSYTAGDAELHLVRWTQIGGIEDLGVPSGLSLAVLWRWPDVPVVIGPRINNSGQIVLIAIRNSDGAGVAWQEPDGFIPLPDFSGGFSQPSFAVDIDDAGQVAGVAVGSSDEVAALWTVPASSPPDPPDPPAPPAPTPDPGPTTGGGGAGNSSTGGTGSGVGNTGAAAPTLPATGPSAVVALVVVAAGLLVAGGATTVGRRLTPVRVRVRRRGGPGQPRGPRP